jgi:hypothetical protein
MENQLCDGYDADDEVKQNCDVTEMNDEQCEMTALEIKKIKDEHTQLIKKHANAILEIKNIRKALKHKKQEMMSYMLQHKKKTFQTTDANIVCLIQNRTAKPKQREDTQDSTSTRFVIRIKD